MKLDRSGAVLELNQAAAELLAVTPAEILARPASILGEPWGGYLRTPQSGPLRWRREPDGTWLIHLCLPPTSDQLNDLREALIHAESDEAKTLLVRAVSALLTDAPGGLWEHDSGILRPLVVSGGIPHSPAAASDVWAVRLGRKLVHQGPLALDPLPFWLADDDVEVLPLYSGAFLVGLLVGPLGLWSEGEGAKIAADARRVLSGAKGPRFALVNRPVPSD